MRGIKETLAALMDGQDLGQNEARTVMKQIVSDRATPVQVGALLAALHMKGETVEEIAGCALAMRDLSQPVRPQRTDLVDISGTGGDRTGTFNISTTAAFVVAGAGLAVAKHGARAVSSLCGSADLLEALGVNLQLFPDAVARCIDEIGIGFLFAPALHPAVQHAGEARREIGVRTVFDILGPLTNPAGAKAQVLGVYSADLTEPLANVLGRLGSRSAYVVYGADGLDELSTTGVNKVSCLSRGQIRTFALDATELGLKRTQPSALRGGTPAENAEITRSALSGERGPRRDVVVLNAAAALVVGEKARNLTEAVGMAEEAIDSGQAVQVLERLVAASREMGR